MTLNHAVEILIVEDTPEDLELTLRALRKANLANHIEIARDGAVVVTIPPRAGFILGAAG